MLFSVVVTIVALLAALGLLLFVAVRALRRFVRAFWPHS
jgi:hypothetical protein